MEQYRNYGMNIDLLEKSCSNGLVNQTENIIGLRINTDPRQELILIEPGHFYSFYDNKDFFIEISHSRKLRFYFEITSRLIYYYRDVGILTCHKDNKSLNLSTVQNEIFEEKETDYYKLESNMNKLQQQFEDSNGII